MSEQAHIVTDPVCSGHHPVDGRPGAALSVVGPDRRMSRCCGFQGVSDSRTQHSNPDRLNSTTLAAARAPSVALLRVLARQTFVRGPPAFPDARAVPLRGSNQQPHHRRRRCLTGATNRATYGAQRNFCGPAGFRAQWECPAPGLQRSSRAPRRESRPVGRVTPAPHHPGPTLPDSPARIRSATLTQCVT